MLQIQKKAFSNRESVIASFHNNRYRKPLHIHQFAELVYVIDGEFTVTASGKHETAKKGDIIIIQPYQPHRFFTDEGKSVNIWMLLFSGSLITDIMNRGVENKKYKTVIFTPSEEIKFLIERRMFSTREEPVQISENESRRIKALLYPIIDEYVTKVPLTDEIANVRSHSLAEALNYMALNFRDDLTLEKVASAIGYSKSQISHSLSSELSMNFNTILNSFRIEYAKNLILTKDMSMFRIALESGFNCERSFCRAFYKVMNTSPKKYRDSHLRLKSSNKK